MNLVQRMSSVLVLTLGATGCLAPVGDDGAAQDPSQDPSTESQGIIVLPLLCGLPVVRNVTLPSDHLTQSAASAITETAAQSSSCGTHPGQVYNLYRLTTASTIGVDLRGTFNNTNRVRSISIRRACGSSSTELSCNSFYGQSALPADHARVRATLTAGTWYVVIGYDAAHPTYSVDLTTYTPASNTDCASALPVPAAGLVGEDPSRGGQPANQCTDAPSDALNGNPPLYYSLAVPAGMTGALVATPQNSLTGAIALANSCSPSSCFGLRLGTAKVMHAANATAAAQTLSFTAQGHGLFDVRSYVGVAPTHRALATPLTIGTGTFTAQNPLFGDEAACFTQDGRGPNHMLFYRVTVPALRTLQVQTSPTAEASWTTAIAIADASTPTTCMTALRSASSASFANNSFVSRTVLVAVGALNDMTAIGRFNLSVSIF